MSYTMKQRQRTAEFDSIKKERTIRFAPYEGIICEKRVNTIYDGLCSKCEMNRRKDNSDKKF